jgi:hypothetical protein
MKQSYKQKLRFLLEPKAMLLGFALFYYVSDYVFWKRLISTCSSQTLPCYPPEHEPMMSIPFILLLASIALWLSRYWSYPIAMWLSGWIFYNYSYKMLASCTFMVSQPLFSRVTFKCWWTIVSVEAPRFLLYLAFSAIVFLYAAISLARYIYGQYHLRGPFSSKCRTADVITHL